MKKDIVIKIILLVLVVAVISSTLTSLVVTNTLSSNKLLGSVSHSDYLDSSNVTYLDSNVQDSIDNLYTQANDYSSINTRVNTLEGYFRKDTTSSFDGPVLRINENGSGDGGIALYNNNGVVAAAMGNIGSDGGFVINSWKNNNPGTGELQLNGNPVKINGTSINDYLAIKTYELPGVAVAGTTVSDYSFNIQYSGYIPIGVVGTIIGAGGPCSLVSSYLSNSTTASVRIRNNATTSHTPLNIIISVLYIKS